VRQKFLTQVSVEIERPESLQVFSVVGAGGIEPQAQIDFQSFSAAADTASILTLAQIKKT
jgi:hypothetical protein